MVTRCGEEAKIVAVEQEAKKIADASAKAADRAALLQAAKGSPDTASADAKAFANAAAEGGGTAKRWPRTPVASDTTFPATLEATRGRRTGNRNP